MKNFYPSLSEFLKERRHLSALYEDEKEENTTQDVQINKNKSEAEAQIRNMKRASTKMIDQEYVVSPITGLKINIKKLDEEIEKIKFKIVTQSPLYRPFIHDMTPTIYTWLLPTMATDGVRLFVNPDFALNLSFLGKLFVLLHEITHAILVHQIRIGVKDPRLFNIAADYEVNGILSDTFPEDFTPDFITKEIHGLYNQKYLNIPVEEIYDDLLKNGPMQNMQSMGIKSLDKQKGAANAQKGATNAGEGGSEEGEEGEEGVGKEGKKREVGGKAKGNKGSDSSNPNDSNDPNEQMKKNVKKQMQIEGTDDDPGNAGSVISKNLGEKIAKAEGYDGEEGRIGQDTNDKWMENAKKMMEIAEKMKLAGNSPGNVLIDKLKKLTKPAVDWKALLKAYIGYALSSETEWRIGAKKHLYRSDEYLKRGLKIKNDALKKVFVIVDASGSMFSQMNGMTILERVISEIAYIVKSKRMKEIIVIFFDSIVDPDATQIIKLKSNVNSFDISKIDLSKASLGGGTNFQAPLDYIKDVYKDSVNLAIFLTDGFAEMPQRPSYSNKFIWIVYDNRNFSAPFGRLIKVDLEDLKK